MPDVVREIEYAMFDFRDFLRKHTGMEWKLSSSNGDWFNLTVPKWVSVGIPGWGGYARPHEVRVTFDPSDIRYAKALDPSIAGKLSYFTKDGKETAMQEKILVADILNPARSRLVARLVKEVADQQLAKVASVGLRTRLIRLAHAKPELRPLLLPLVRS